MKPIYKTRFSKKKTNGTNRKGSPNILYKTCFNTKNLTFFSQLNTFFQQEIGSHNFVKQKKNIIRIRSISQTMSDIMGGEAVLSKYHKMDMNKYPNIF